jgi:hypothetical protein
MVFFLGLASIVGGFIMILPLFTDKNPSLKNLYEKISPYKILIGLAILVIGVITFFVPYHWEGHPLVPIFGDLIPSVLAILCGLFISVEFLENLKGIKGSFIEKLKSILHTYQFPIGFGAMFFGFLHWFLFKVLFL